MQMLSEVLVQSGMWLGLLRGILHSLEVTDVSDYEVEYIFKSLVKKRVYEADKK